MNDVINKIKKQSIAFDKADIIDKIFGKKNTVDYKNRPTVLFGAGSASKNLYPVLKEHGLNISCFCDNNHISGRLLYGLPVISFDELSRTHLNNLVIVSTSIYYNTIRKQLLNSGFSKDNIFGIDPGPLKFYTHIEQWRWRDEDFKLYENQLQRTYDLLADKKSKDIFLRRTALLYEGSDYHSFCSMICDHSSFLDLAGFDFLAFERISGSEPECYLYFNNDVYEPENGEVFIDVGAHTGDSAKQFIEACNNRNIRYGKIFCMEPDLSNYKKLTGFTKGGRNICCINKGAWSSEQTLSFQNSEAVIKTGNAHICKEGTGYIEVCRIDDVVGPDENVSLIKMDIEGAEYEALKGATDTIRKSKPTLIVSAYHNRNDIFTLANCIDDICKGYKFYIRLFSNAFIETVLIAVA